MQVHVLASGSKGNAVFMQFGTTKILIDAGISARRTEQLLASIGVKFGDMNALLITHEHSDHIRGLDVLTRRHAVPVYTRSAVWHELSCRDQIPASCRKELGESLEIGDLLIKPFRISHDAVDPVGFEFHYRGCKAVLATDLGVVTPEVLSAVSNADVMVLESNHDPLMLTNGPYPAFLKQRIRGPVGHLSNMDAAKMLSQMKRKSTMDVFLAHQSQQNNHPELAERTVREYLTARGAEVGKEIILHQTYQDHLVSLAHQA